MTSKSCYINKNFFDFILRKHMDFDEIQQDFSDRLTEDEYNTDYAEAALDVAFDIFPEGPGKDENDVMDNRHEFVGEFLEYIRCEVIKKWAKNLGMMTKEEADHKANAQAAFVTQRFKNMSSYEFSAWKLNVPANDKTQERIMEQVEDSVFYDAKYGEDDNLPSEYEPQDSEDECWEQMIAQQRANNNHSQDI